MEKLSSSSNGYRSIFLLNKENHLGKTMGAEIKELRKIREDLDIIPISTPPSHSDAYVVNNVF